MTKMNSENSAASLPAQTRPPLSVQIRELAKEYEWKAGNIVRFFDKLGMTTEQKVEFLAKEFAGAVLFDKFRARAAAPVEPPKDDNRCAVCGWQLSDSTEKGCVRGNCSLRPRPENLYDSERAEKERITPKLAATELVEPAPYDYDKERNTAFAAASSLVVRTLNCPYDEQQCEKGRCLQGDTPDQKCVELNQPVVRTQPTPEPTCPCTYPAPTGVRPCPCCHGHKCLVHYPPRHPRSSSSAAKI